MTEVVSARERFVAFPLDGALLFFQPSTGTTLRVENERTSKFRRQAPRVVMFGITNQCNLSCGFCSRDSARRSEWTVATALTMLQQLARQGTLEVAFGGGEPFAFRGFAELVGELHASTSLALHVTTNGTLLDAQRFAPFRGRFGQVRISIYDDPRWRIAAHTLNDAGQLWGANVLVDAKRLETLPQLFAHLTALGCHDVSILSYVGGDPALQLDALGRSRLSAILADAPLTCRVSVCLGDALTAPRLFNGVDDGGDCGAGYDFLTLTPDRRVQSCSFRDSSLAVQTADDVLRVWSERQDYLRRASRRVGCSRAAPGAPTTALPVVNARHGSASRAASLKLWRAFSGNNSGECVLVGKFESNEQAKRYLAELTHGYEPDGDYSAEWRALFDAEQVSLSSTRDGGEIWGQSPSSLVAVGSSVVALGYDAGDAFPELRALTWKRSGYVAPGGIHLHESPSLLAAIRGRDADDVRELASAAARAPYPAQPHAHGCVLFVRIPNATDDKGLTFAERVQHLETLAAERPLGVEVLAGDWDEAEFVHAKQRLGVELSTAPRLAVWFHGADSEQHAKRFAEQCAEAHAHAFKDFVLIEGVTRRKRLAVLALRQNGYVHPLDGSEVDVSGYFWLHDPPPQKGKKAPPAPELDAVALGRALEREVGVQVKVEARFGWRKGARASVRSAQPARVLAAMVRVADQFGTELNLGLQELEVLGFMLRRLLADVSR